jgi:multidrug efflux pump subunit AcrA (membrane-fusion protein)
MYSQDKKQSLLSLPFYKTRIFKIILTILAIILLAVGINQLGFFKPKQKPNYFTVFKSDLQKYVKDSSILEPNELRKVSAPNGSKVSELFVTGGKEVNGGQLIAKVEQGDRTINITSPITGVIVKSNYVVGEYVNQTELFQVADNTNFKVTATVSTSEINAVKVDQLVRVKIKTIDTEKEYDATVISVNANTSLSKSNEFTSNYDVKIKLNEKPKNAITGMKVNVTIYGDKRESAILVENNLIFQKSDGSKYIRLVDWINKDQNIFALKDTKITTGLEGEKYTEVLTGVNDGEQITTPNDKSVVKPGFSLVPGSN